METNYTALFIILIVTIVIFLICREIMCWYWKINKSIANQEKIISLLQQLVDKKEASLTCDNNTVNTGSKYKNYIGYKVELIQNNGVRQTGLVVASDKPDEYLHLNTEKETLKIKLDNIKHIKTI